MTSCTSASASDAAQTKPSWPQWKNRQSRQGGPPAGEGAVYGLGVVGALVYFLQTADSGWDYVLAFPKASVWPALLVYKLLKSFSS